MSDKTEWVVRPAEAQPAAPSGAVNVIGMPEFDGLLDHIYEHGTTAEGVIERANAFARAVLAQYAPQQPASQPAAPAPCAFRSLLAEARRQYRDSDAAGDVLAWLDERVLETDYAAPSEQVAENPLRESEDGPDTHGCDHATSCGFCRAERSMAASVAVPEGLIYRVEEAARRIDNGHAPRRIPAEPTDVDLVLGEVLAWLKGEPAPFWVPAAAPVAPEREG